MDKYQTLRSLKGAVIVIECKRCGVHGAMDRKVLVKRFKASAPMSRVRRGVFGYCERMCGEDGDRCDARLATVKNAAEK